jgi:hypothetical protein
MYFAMAHLVIAILFVILGGVTLIVVAAKTLAARRSSGRVGEPEL